MVLVVADGELGQGGGAEADLDDGEVNDASGRGLELTLQASGDRPKNASSGASYPRCHSKLLTCLNRDLLVYGLKEEDYPYIPHRLPPFLGTFGFSIKWSWGNSNNAMSRFVMSGIHRRIKTFFEGPVACQFEGPGFVSRTGGIVALEYP